MPAVIISATELCVTAMRLFKVKSSANATVNREGSHHTLLIAFQRAPANRGMSMAWAIKKGIVLSMRREQSNLAVRQR